MQITQLYKSDNQQILLDMQQQIAFLGGFPQKQYKDGIEVQPDPEEHWGTITQGLDGYYYLERIPDEIINQKIQEGSITQEQVDNFRSSFDYEIVVYDYFLRNIQKTEGGIL